MSRSCLRVALGAMVVAAIHLPGWSQAGEANATSSAEVFAQLKACYEGGGETHCNVYFLLQACSNDVVAAGILKALDAYKDDPPSASFKRTLISSVCRYGFLEAESYGNRPGGVEVFVPVLERGLYDASPEVRQTCLDIFVANIATTNAWSILARARQQKDPLACSQVQVALDAMVEARRVGEAARENPAWRRYSEYCLQLSSGSRDQAAKALDAFCAESANWYFDQRRVFVKWLCQQMDDPILNGERRLCPIDVPETWGNPEIVVIKPHPRICPPLLMEKLLLPVLAEWAANDSTNADARALQGCYGGKLAACAEAVALDGDNQRARIVLASKSLWNATYALYQLPRRVPCTTNEVQGAFADAKRHMQHIREGKRKQQLLADLQAHERVYQDWLQFKTEAGDDFERWCSARGRHYVWSDPFRREATNRAATAAEPPAGPSRMATIAPGTSIAPGGETARVTLPDWELLGRIASTALVRRIPALSARDVILQRMAYGWAISSARDVTNEYFYADFHAVGWKKHIDDQDGLVTEWTTYRVVVGLDGCVSSNGVEVTAHYSKDGGGGSTGGALPGDPFCVLPPPGPLPKPDRGAVTEIALRAIANHFPNVKTATLYPRYVYCHHPGCGVQVVFGHSDQPAGKHERTCVSLDDAGEAEFVDTGLPTHNWMRKGTRVNWGLFAPMRDDWNLQ